MKYTLIKESHSSLIETYIPNSNNYILEVKKKKKIIIISQKIIDKLILKEIMKELNPLLNKIVKYLASDEEDEETSSLLFDDLSKQRSIILKKYEKLLSAGAINSYMKKIRFLVLELKRKLYSYNNHKTKSRSR